MAYAYQLNRDGSAAAGYVKFSITPDIFRHTLIRGDTFTIRGEAKCGTAAINGFGVRFMYGGVSGGFISITKSAGQSFTFTLECVFEGQIERGRVNRLKFQFFPADAAVFSYDTDYSQDFFSVNYRAAPTASVSIADTTGAYSVFGKFVPDVSRVSITHNAAADPYDPETVIQSVMFCPPWSEAIDITADNADIGVLKGEYLQPDRTWRVTVTDNRGMTSEVTGTWDAISYSLPRIEAFTAERYREVTLESGETVYEPDDSSPLVRISFEAAVCALAAQGISNAWTAKVTCGGYTHEFMSGGDTTPVTSADNRDAVDTLLTELSEHEITLTITDLFSSVASVCRVPKCGGIFNIERTGVAVGKMSSGTLAQPKFECAYPAYFSEGIYDAGGSSIGGAVYSAVPVPCGTWLDGRTVYRAVVPLERRSSTGTFYVDLPVTVERLINLYGSVRAQEQQHPVNSHYSTEYRFYARLYSPAQLICVNGKTYTDGFIILEYLTAEEG